MAGNRHGRDVRLRPGHMGADLALWCLRRSPGRLLGATGLLVLAAALGVASLWLFAPLFIFAVANAALAATLVERLIGKKIPVFSFVLYSALVFANPWYQVHVKSDPLAVFSLTLILISFHVWRSFVVRPQPWHIPAIVVLVAFSSFIKESYFCVIGLFFLIELITQKGRRRPAALDSGARRRRSRASLWRGPAHFRSPGDHAP